jgi:hypothetical protein
MNFHVNKQVAMSHWYLLSFIRAFFCKSLGNMRWRSSTSSIPSFIVCMCFECIGMWEGLKTINACAWKLSQNVFEKIGCRCPFSNHSFSLIPSWNQTIFFSSTWYVCLLSTWKSLPLIKHGSLVKLFKNVKIWRLLVISRLALSMVGIFHSSINFFLNQRIQPWNSLKLYLVKLLKFQHFTLLLGS